MQKSLSDSELLNLLRNDKEEAIDYLFQQFYTVLCQTSYRLLKNTAFAEDVVQEVFMEVWKKRHFLKIQTAFFPYLRKSVVNKSLNFIRDNKLNTWTSEEPLVNLDSNSKTLPDLEAEDLRQMVDKIVDQLPDKCRLVFILNRFEEMSYKEISELMGISVKTVENHILKALKILRDQLGPHL